MFGADDECNNEVFAGKKYRMASGKREIRLFTSPSMPSASMKGWSGNRWLPLGKGWSFFSKRSSSG